MKIMSSPIKADAKDHSILSNIGRDTRISPIPANMETMSHMTGPNVTSMNAGDQENGLKSQPDLRTVLSPIPKDQDGRSNQASPLTNQ